MENIKLNLGSGDQKIPGYVNVDLHYPADVRDDIRKLDNIQNECAEEIYIAHAIMYLIDSELDMCLSACYKKLMKGGRIVIEDPIKEEEWEWCYIREPEEEVMYRMTKFKNVRLIPQLAISRHGKNVWTVEGYK